MGYVGDGPKPQLEVGDISTKDVTATGDLTVDTNTLYVDSTNNRVGINDATPSEELDINGDGSDVKIRMYDGAGASVGRIAHSGANFDISNTATASATLTFTTGSGSGTERMRIDSSGNVGIGTSSPSHPLTIQADGTSGNAIKILGDSTNESGRILWRNNADSSITAEIEVDSSENMIFGAGGGTEDMRIDSSGNVGIGTSSPDQKIHVSGAGTQSIRIENTNTNLIVGSVIGSVEFEGNDLGASGVTAAVKAVADSVTGKAALVFDTGTAGSSTEAARLDSSGNLLVGMTSAGSNTRGAYLDGDGFVSFTRDNDRVMVLGRGTGSGTDGDILEFRKDGTKVGSISSISGVVSQIILDPRTSSFKGAGLSGGSFDASSALLVPRDGAGNTSDGTLDLGGDTSRFRNLKLSGSVYLGGTGSANALDDYEEGTWTPTIATGTINAGSARYTKIGNLVHVTCQITTFSDRTSTNSVTIGGLPFSCVSDSFAVSATLHRYVNTAIGGDSVLVYQGPSTTTLIPHTCKGNDNYDVVQHNNLSSASTQFYISHTYRT